MLKNYTKNYKALKTLLYTVFFNSVSLADYDNCSCGCEHRSPTHQLFKYYVYGAQPLRRELKDALP